MSGRARLKYTITTADGMRLESSGEHPDRVTFAIHMLASGFGTGKVLAKTKDVIALHRAAKAYLEVADQFRDADREDEVGDE